MTDIDTRARAAGAALLESVQPEAASSPPRRSPLPRLVFAAIAVLVVAASVVVLARRGDGGDSTVASGPGAPRLVVDPVPDGFALVGAQDLPAAGASFTITTFGNGEGADLYRDADLMVGVRSLGADEDMTPGETATTIAVRGTTGQLEVSDYGVVVSFEVEPGVGAFVVSRSLSSDEVVQAADALRFDERGAVAVDGELPRGLALVGTSTMSTAGGIAELVRQGSHVASYRDLRGENAFSVVSQDGSGSVLDVQRWVLRSSVRAVEVNGRRGFIGGLEDGETPYRELIFEREDGMAAIGGNLAEERLLELAGALRPATDEEWGDASTAQGEPLVPAGAKASLEGSLDPNQRWAVYVGADGVLCASMQDADHGSASCVGAPIGAPDPDKPDGGLAGPQTLHDNSGTPRAVFGFSPAGAVRVVLDNGAQQTEAQTTPFEDRVLYAGVLDPFPTQVIFYAADGSELARQPVNQ